MQKGGINMRKGQLERIAVAAAVTAAVTWFLKRIFR
jgi:hypothetical protein